MRRRCTVFSMRILSAQSFRKSVNFCLSAGFISCLAISFKFSHDALQRRSICARFSCSKSKSTWREIQTFFSTVVHLHCRWMYTATLHRYTVESQLILGPLMPMVPDTLSSIDIILKSGIQSSTWQSLVPWILHFWRWLRRMLLHAHKCMTVYTCMCTLAERVIAPISE